jgi:DNA-binding LytR/AlgR family response regulator
MLRVLAVDDEPPALHELVYLLRADPRVASVESAGDAAAALRLLHRADRAEDGAGGGFDAIFLDIQMPGLDGLDLARVLAKFAHPPRVVFVTAHDGFAVDAFDLKAVDYVLKPVRASRIAEAVRRVAEVRDRQVIEPPPAVGGRDENVPVEVAGVTRFVKLGDIRYAEAQGDYARLHTVDGGSHLVRVPLSVLEERWAAAGFLRIHRSYLVAVPHIEELTFQGSQTAVLLGGGRRLAVSRRHARELRDLLVRKARPAAKGADAG